MSVYMMNVLKKSEVSKNGYFWQFLWLCCINPMLSPCYGQIDWPIDGMPKPQPQKYQTTNWQDDNRSLKQQGSLLLWIDKEMEGEHLAVASKVGRISFPKLPSSFAWWSRACLGWRCVKPAEWCRVCWSCRVSIGRRRITRRCVAASNAYRFALPTAPIQRDCIYWSTALA